VLLILTPILTLVWWYLPYCTHI